jgi:tetratricopeptide (TPR) repeat protein
VPDSNARFRLADEITLLERSLADLELEFAEGELSQGDYERLRSRDHAQLMLARSALEASQQEAEPAVDQADDDRSGEQPAARRRRSWLLVLGFSCIALAALGFAATLLVNRDPGSTSGGQAQLNPAQQLANDLADARSYVAANDLGRAISKYSAVLQLRPRNSEALAEFGWLSYRESMLSGDRRAATKAEAFVRRAVVLEPKRAATHFFAGAIAWQLHHDAKAAVAEFDQFLRLAPSAEQLTAAAPYLRRAYGALGLAVPAAQTP